MRQPSGQYRECTSGDDTLNIATSDDALARIRVSGEMLFVWPVRSRGPRLTLTLLEAVCDPPPGALEYRRVDAGDFLLFLHPAIRRLPRELTIEMHGLFHPHVAVYWEGLAYVVDASVGGSTDMWVDRL